MYTEDFLRKAKEMHHRITNATRRQILVYIYQEPKNYTQLIDHTGLKPGSLYHHLKILNGLVEKRDHGLYAITDLGRQVIESLELVEEVKPKVRRNVETGPTRLDRSGVSNQEKLDQILWIGLPNYIIIGTLLVITIYLGLNDVALAGSAIYAVANLNALLFDLLAIFLGWFALYLMEQFHFKSKPYHSAFFSMAIRVMMMLPAIIVGIGIAIIFFSGSQIASDAFPILFAITVVLGFLVAVNGLQYLRGVDHKTAVNMALVPSLIDILLGLVVFVSI